MMIFALHCNIFQCFIRVVQNFLLTLLKRVAFRCVRNVSLYNIMYMYVTSLSPKPIHAETQSGRIVARSGSFRLFCQPYVSVVNQSVFERCRFPIGFCSLQMTFYRISQIRIWPLLTTTWSISTCLEKRKNDWSYVFHETERYALWGATLITAAQTCCFDGVCLAPVPNSNSLWGFVEQVVVFTCNLFTYILLWHVSFEPI